jgi:ubiquitin carboxyl-terminal hydrolase 35/38
MNCVLQALFMEDEFYNSVLSQSVTPKQPVLLHLQALFAFLTLSKRASYAPREFCHLTRPPWFRQGLQQDCSEFVHYLLDQLHEEECALGDNSESLVKKHFMGTFQIVCVCNSCKSQSLMEEPFTEMALGFPYNCRSPDSLMLHELISDFVAVEILSDENQYFCDKCQKKNDAHRQVMVKDIPQCLILSLKRFAYDAETKTRSKVLREVTCPLVLELPVIGKEHRVQFILSSVVVHSGVSSDCGHYYTYARHSTTAKKAHKLNSEETADQSLRHSRDGWFLFNDSHVTCSSFESICNLTKRFSKDTAYLLFYSLLTDDGTEVPERVSQLPKAFIDLVADDNIKFLEEQEAESKRLLALQYGKWTGSSRQPWDYDSDDDSGPSSKGGPPGSCGLGGNGLGQKSNRIVF